MEPQQNPVQSAEPTDRKSYQQSVPAADQAARILYFLAEAPEGRASLTEVCRHVGINKSKGLALLNTLKNSGLVIRSEYSKVYRLGPGLLVLSRALLEHTDIASSAGPFLRNLADATGSTALLGSVSGEQTYVIARRTSADLHLAQIAVQVGHRFPLYYGSHGKAILAALSEEERERVLTGSELHFAELAENHDLGALRAEVAECARLGYGRDLGGINRGVNSLAVPLFGRNSALLGCLWVVGTFPAAKAAEYGKLVVSAAQAMSLSFPFLSD
jgi:DNA-binding IclR family transcriptional regulator